MARRSTDRSLQALLAAITDSTATAPDEEILADAAESGENPEVIAAGVSEIIARSVKRAKQRKLDEARAGLDAARKAYTSRATRIPADPDAQRALYYRVLQHHPEFTLQQRDLEALPTDEVAEILKQMEALGLLPNDE